MKRILFSILILSSVIGATYAQKSTWKFITPEQVVLPESDAQWMQPSKFATLDLDFKAFKNQVWSAPMEFTSSKGKVVSIPMPDGTSKNFEVFQSPSMEDGLSAKFPDIRSFAGTNIKDRSEKIRLDISHLGVKCIFDSEKGTVYIDPFARKQTRYYMSYYRTDNIRNDDHNHPFKCGTDEYMAQLSKDATELVEEKPIVTKNNSRTTTLPLNKYRIAIAATALYSQFIGTTVGDVIAEINTAVNRINQVLVNDLSVKFLLINDNDKIVFFDDSADGYTDGDLGQMIGWNSTVLAKEIGKDNYDIGHVFGRSFAGGVVGLAQLAQVCRNAKGRGGSTLFIPQNDSYWIDIVAHEMGHQMGANHSFNNCSQNENPGTAYEPGSGSTIMSYSGACGSNDIQVNSNDMYNVGAIEEITSYMHVSYGKDCAVVMDMGNHIPEVNIPTPSNFYIPLSTPFELNCKASDEDGDTLTYSWEEYDLGPQSPLGMPILDAPAFRVYAPQALSNRVFPRLDRIVSNQSNITEVLPTYARNLTFKVVVRDNHFGGGATAQDVIYFKATDKAGPFLVTSPNTFTTWEMTSTQKVTWDVANTDVSPVNCKNVNILLSIDGGYTYPYTLACNTANDGTEDVIVPALDKNVTSARIKVQAADNIFFDLSNQNFAVVAPTKEALYFGASNCFEKFCTPKSLDVNIFMTPFGGYDNDVTLEVKGLPSGATASFGKNPLKPTETTDLTLDFDQSVLSGTYLIELTAQAPGLDTFTSIIPVQVVSSTFGAYALSNPINGASGVTKAPAFSWAVINGAQSYDIEIATTPDFGANIIEQKFGLLDPNYTLSNPLTESTLYFWRIRPNNECKEGDWSEVNAFHTITLSCDNFKNLDGKKGISATGTPTVTSKITIIGNGEISDVSVSNMKGFHEYFGDLDVSLNSPKGTSIVLFHDQCNNFGNNFDFGLDDNASKPFACPPTMGNIFKPSEAFSVFKNEESAGEWVLTIHDDQSSGGGQLDEWTLKVCTSVSLNPPYLITNDTLKLKPLTGKTIDLLHLETGDQNNTPDQLIYTLVKLPVHGILGNSGTPLYVGNHFTQADINNGKFSYFNLDSNFDDDDFLFVVQDGEGGWIGILQFNVKTDNSILISTNEVQTSPILIYPNPTNDNWKISIIDNKLPIDKIEVYNIQGKKVQTYSTQDISSGILSTNDIPSGMYIVNVLTSKGNYTQKLLIQK